MPFDAADLAEFVDSDMPGFVSATINGVSVDGLFSGPPTEAFGLVGGNAPVLRVLGTVEVAVDDAVTVGSMTFEVDAINRPLGPLSLIVLRLREAA